MIEKKTIYRENFPGYMGHIPLKQEVIGMTCGATNQYTKKVLANEPVYEAHLFPQTQDDYREYRRDYFNENFSRNYKLEEDLIHTNNSKQADTWIGGDKYKIYPQHIPSIFLLNLDYKAHIPGIYSSNLFGKGYSRITAEAIKGDYCKGFDTVPEDKYKSMNKKFFDKPVETDNQKKKELRPASVGYDPNIM